MTAIRGLMSPRRSSRSRAGGKKKTAPPNPEEQQSWRRTDTQIATNSKRRNNLGPPNSSGIHLPKSTLKIASSRRRTEQPPNPNTKIATKNSFGRSNSNLKGGFGFSSSRSLGGSRKYFDSPNASPKPYRSLGTKEELFGSESKAQRILFKIYMEIASHRQGNSSITSYFTKLKVLWDQLAKTYTDNLPQYSSDAIEMLSEHMEREKVIQFLVGLNDSYSSICSKILLRRPFPSVDIAFSVIIRKENRRKLVISSEEVVEKKISVQND